MTAVDRLNGLLEARHLANIAVCDAAAESL